MREREGERGRMIFGYGNNGSLVGGAVLEHLSAADGWRETNKR